MSFLSKFSPNREPTKGINHPSNTDVFLRNLEKNNTEIAIKHGTLEDSEKTDYFRGMPAREDPKSGNIITILGQEETVHTVNLTELATIITEARDSEANRSLLMANGIKPDQIESTMDIIGINIDVVHREGPEGKWIRHTLQKATPEGVLYFPNRHLERQGSYLVKATEGDPSEWLRDLSEGRIATDHVESEYTEEPEYARRLGSDSMYSPEADKDILKFVDESYINGSLYIIIKAPHETNK